jgi:hypothetical protein
MITLYNQDFPRDLDSVSEGLVIVAVRGDETDFLCKQRLETIFHDAIVMVAIVQLSRSSDLILPRIPG